MEIRQIKLDGGIGIGSLDTKYGVSDYFNEKSRGYVDGTVSYEELVKDIIEYHREGCSV